MKTSKAARPRKPGRPLSFDRETALEQAMLLFWRHGYESTSVGDLTRAMGITAPSLYAAFGDKKQLFLEAVDRYVSGGKVTSRQIIHDASTAREAAQNLLRISAVAFTGPDTPPGCLLASATISCSAAARDVQMALSELRLQIETQLLLKIRHDIATGKLPRDTEPRPLAALYLAVIQGMSTLARDGAKRSKLIAIADAAMQAWPKSRLLSNKSMPVRT